MISVALEFNVRLFQVRTRKPYAPSPWYLDTGLVHSVLALAINVPGCVYGEAMAMLPRLES